MTHDRGSFSYIGTFSSSRHYTCFSTEVTRPNWPHVWDVHLFSTSGDSLPPTPQLLMTILANFLQEQHCSEHSALVETGWYLLMLESLFLTSSLHYFNCSTFLSCHFTSPIPLLLSPLLLLPSGALSHVSLPLELSLQFLSILYSYARAPSILLLAVLTTYYGLLVPLSQPWCNTTFQ